MRGVMAGDDLAGLRGSQACGCHVTGTPLRGGPPAMKALAVLLHGMGALSLGGIGHLPGPATPPC